MNKSWSEVISGGLAIGVAALLLGVYVIHAARDSGKVPERHALARAAGLLGEVERGRSAVRFRLQNDGRRFEYHSKGGEVRRVHEMLAAARGTRVELLFDPKDGSVFEVVAGSLGARRYEEVAAAWRQDRAVGTWLGWAFVLAGIGFSVRAFLRRPAGG